VATGDVAADSKLIDPNTATREQVLSTPGMTEAAGEALLAGRPYDDMLEVDRVLAQHLNEQQRDSVYARLWRPLDLNTATKEEILLIPGVGPRMQHEFEEYRPYTSIAQFRREIGKYVDDDEVARLEQYVTIR
jgi:DNA uptake protein ComE-like DNA-binding protein